MIYHVHVDEAEIERYAPSTQIAPQTITDWM